MKEKIYNIIADFGIWAMQTIFPEYFAVEPLRPTDRYYEYPFVLQSLLPLPAKVLDVGCSGSMFPLILKALKYETYGIDIRNYYPEGKFFFIKDDIRISTLDSNFFDMVTAISSIEHIGLKGRYGVKEDLEGDIKALKEIHRILKPNGLLLMTIPVDTKFELNRNHRIYNLHNLNKLLDGFSYHLEIIQSPEANYKIALIKANKI